MAIVRNIQNNDLYLYLGEDKYRNIRTQKEGVVLPEMAQTIFKINIEATHFYYENPLFEDLIHGLNLKFDNIKKTENE